ncbi:penicillin-binding transpeptidase domain-containing protein, partial [Parasutterella sp.]
DFMKPFGFGQITGIDLVGEARGILPSREWKQRRFKQRWAQGDTISIGIGQGYNAFTILQLAHAVATLANDGIVMKPHLVKKIINSKTGEEEIVAKNPVDVIPLKKENVNFIKRAMQDVTQKGTGRAIFAGAPYTIGGKTGTAQVLGIKQGETYNKNKIKERHRDHSLFIAFAPVDKPKIALAIMVENGGFGAAAAAPLARKILDYYLIEQNKDKSSTEEAGKEKSQQTKPRNTAAEKKAVKPADKPQTTAAGTGKGKKE